MNHAITPRFIPAAILALAIGFALQLVMQSLINQNVAPRQERTQVTQIFIAKVPPPPPTRHPTDVRPPDPIEPPPIDGLTQMVPVPVPKPAPGRAPIAFDSAVSVLPPGQGWAGLSPVLPDLAARARSPIRPIYPDRARRNDKSGNVIVAFTVLADGSAADIEIEDVDPRGFGFEQAVRRALRGTVFVSAVKDGRNIDSRLRQNFVFDLETH